MSPKVFHVSSPCLEVKPLTMLSVLVVLNDNIIQKRNDCSQVAHSPTINYFYLSKYTLYLIDISVLEIG